MPKDTQNETKNETHNETKSGAKDDTKVEAATAPKRVTPKILITDMPTKPDLKIVPPQTLAEIEAGRQALAKHKR